MNRWISYVLTGRRNLNKSIFQVVRSMTIEVHNEESMCVSFHFDWSSHLRTDGVRVNQDRQEHSSILSFFFSVENDRKSNDADWFSSTNDQKPIDLMSRESLPIIVPFLNWGESRWWRQQKYHQQEEWLTAEFFIFAERCWEMIAADFNHSKKKNIRKHDHISVQMLLVIAQHHEFFYIYPTLIIVRIESAFVRVSYSEGSRKIEFSHYSNSNTLLRLSVNLSTIHNFNLTSGIEILLALSGSFFSF